MSQYRPAWWIPGPHVRTLWGRFVRRPPVVHTRREQWETPDGDVLDIDRLDAPHPDAPRLILLHGLEGTARSHYARGMLAEARERGWGADFLLFRSCGGTLNRTRRFYHSGDTGDLDLVVNRNRQAYPKAPLVLAGFSLGGNVLLKWLAEHKDSAIRAAAAISVPFDLARGARHIDRGFARVYQANFIASLKRKVYAKLDHFPDLVDRRKLDAVRSIREFDDLLTAPLHGFIDADDYYTRSSALAVLKDVRVPTLLLSAVDDPFLPATVLDDVRKVAEKNKALHVEFVERGGHVGFVSGTVPWRPVYYAEQRVSAFLASLLPDEGRQRPSALGV
jgi:predicted alpha/beta-fold hydrolase